MSKQLKTLIVIAGPTAVGKTSVAVQVARHFKTEIISADSRQCFRELKIGVARPTENELNQVKHHFIASHSIQDEITAAGFEQYALEKLQGIFRFSDLAIVTGGTGLYIKALTEGMDEIPAVPSAIRKEILENFQSRGLPWLQEEVGKTDTEFYRKGEVQNPRRLMRALEVYRFTGRSILDFQLKKKADRDFGIIKIALNIPKEQLHQQISLRVDQMMSQGLLQEVQSLLPYRQLNALQTVGYREIFDYLDGKIPLSQSVEQIRRNTRQYAKRQLTWFRKDPEYHWLHPDAAAVIALVEHECGIKS